MERFLEGEVEMHRTWSVPVVAVGLAPAAERKIPERLRSGLMQPLRRPFTEPTADRLEKILLVHGLIGTTSLQTRRSIRREQQQRLTGTIRLHGSRQEIGHGRAGCGDDGHGRACGCCLTQSQESR